MNQAKPRILMYSHDTYGLGHLRRSLSLAWQLARDLPQAHQLLVTGSMVAGAFEQPPRLDLIKLPALSKRSDGRYKSRSLPLSLQETLDWRQQMILQAALHFRPDLVLVDKAAGGVRGELLPTLDYLRRHAPGTRLVLGLRDIDDAPSATRREWAANGTYRLLDQVYDCILLYGQRSFFDPVAAYRMSFRSAGRLVECGYLRRAEPGREPAAIRRELNVGESPLVVVTVGGGGDGYRILRVYLKMLAEHDPGLHSLVVTGPLMAPGQRALLDQAAAGLKGRGRLTVREFVPDLGSYLAAADLVVSMAGYNTVCELLSLGQRSLLIPRHHTRAEQRIRAQRLARRGLARVLWPDRLTPGRLAEAVTRALAAPRPAVDLNLEGLPRAGQVIADLLAGRRPYAFSGHPLFATERHLEVPVL